MDIHQAVKYIKFDEIKSILNLSDDIHIVCISDGMLSDDNGKSWNCSIMVEYYPSYNDFLIYKKTGAGGKIYKSIPLETYLKFVRNSKIDNIITHDKN